MPLRDKLSRSNVYRQPSMTRSSETRVSVLEYRMNIKWCNNFISLDASPSLGRQKPREHSHRFYSYAIQRHALPTCHYLAKCSGTCFKMDIDNSHTLALPRVFERKHCWTVNFPISFSAKPRYNTVCNTIAAPRYRDSIQGDIQIE